MDHHCPWTLSCVGFGNMPQFMRFLFWVQVTTGFVLVQLFLRLSVYWQDRDLPAYLISVSELIFVVILFLLDLLVFLSILVLFLRCLYHILFTGMTQIESWEKERLESQMRTPRLWRKIRANYLKVHGKNLPVLTSWTNTDYVELDDLDTSPEISEEVPPNFSIDDVIFPYDIGMWANLINTMGPVYCWLWPWGKPSGTGTCFEVNDEVEDQLDLPWPPDAEDQLKEEVVQNLVIDAENEEYVVRPDFMRRSELGRTRWMNDFGERLEDFGVDIDAEGDDEQVLRNRVTSTNPSDEED
ncbi:unnamed protein product [Kuraishia capsulata CBS 1993]|uniref:Palmitoyltransferase n=1 Tax=Kuraishia capsulata CBS 1993 TaxID=1382522 RepID=W6MJE3_9ASCO|nr:uncharacterized protein KUCA_T00002054001 [Kuraishia capsulata CBS 1993]CDK26083.1 unnamed protein product [Kuraishia capsulata CBS 1993]